MRIVSQNRECDVNYDAVQVCSEEINGNHIIVAVLQYFEDEDKCCKFGEYESKERCLEVMDSIRNSYMRDRKVFLMPEE